MNRLLQGKLEKNHAYYSVLGVMTLISANDHHPPLVSVNVDIRKIGHTANIIISIKCFYRKIQEHSYRDFG